MLFVYDTKIDTHKSSWIVQPSLSLSLFYRNQFTLVVSCQHYKHCVSGSKPNCSHFSVIYFIYISSLSLSLIPILGTLPYAHEQRLRHGMEETTGAKTTNTHRRSRNLAHIYRETLPNPKPTTHSHAFHTSTYYGGTFHDLQGLEGHKEIITQEVHGPHRIALRTQEEKCMSLKQHPIPQQGWQCLVIGACP